MKTWADHLLCYYSELQPPKLPAGIAWLYPQKDPQVMRLVDRFLKKFYYDTQPRRLFLGINPGRFGAGITGVNFTAPRQLEQYCGLDHRLGQGSELSAEFIYDMIAAYGGVERFYSRFFIGSICPLGFTREGKNINYYDDRQLLEKVEGFIVENLKKLIAFNADRTVVYAIGGEKNFRYLSSLNERFGWFGEVIPLPHPRFIMQYRRKQKEQFIQLYLQSISK